MTDQPSGAPVREATHVCLTTENEWRPCPASLCEAGDLLGFACGLADELEERRTCLIAARDDLSAIQGAAVEDGGVWIRSVAQRRQQLVEEAIASTDAALRAASALTRGWFTRG